MLYSLSSLSPSSTATSGSDSNEIDEDMHEKLPADSGGRRLAAQHQTEHSTSSSPVKSREYDADHDLMMNSVRSLRDLSSKNRSSVFDIHFDPFNNDTIELRAPATADSTRSLKRVTWANHSLTAAGTPDPGHPKKHNVKSKNFRSTHSHRKSNLKRPQFPRFSHFQNLSQPELSQRPPSSLYTMTPDVSYDQFATEHHKKDGIDSGNTGNTGNLPRHPYEQDLSMDKHFSRFGPPQSTSTLDLAERRDFAPPLTLSSLFSNDSNDLDENGFPMSAPTTVSAGISGKDEQRSALQPASVNTITALSNEFGNLSIESQRQHPKAKPDIIMKDATARFSLRPSQQVGDSHREDKQRMSVQQDSADGSFEDILDRNPPDLPEVSRVEFQNNNNKPVDDGLHVQDNRGRVGVSKALAPTQRSPLTITEQVSHKSLNPGVGTSLQRPDPTAASPGPGTQAMFIVNQRLSRLAALLGKLADLPLSELTDAGSDVPIGEKVGLLEKAIARLSSKFEDKSVMRMMYEGKVSQLMGLVETLTDENSQVKSDARRWRQKYESEVDEFDSAVKRLLRVFHSGASAGETNISREQKVERLISCVKSMLLEHEKLHDMVGDSKKKELELEEARVAALDYQRLREHHEAMSPQMSLTKQLLERHKEMLASLEAEHRNLQMNHDRFVLENQSQAEDLHKWEDKWSQTMQQLRDQTTILCEAETQLKAHTASIQQLEHDLRIKEITIEGLTLEVSTLTDHKSINDRLQVEVDQLRIKLAEIQLLQKEVSDFQDIALRNATLTNEVEHLQSERSTQQEEIRNLVSSLQDHKARLDKANLDAESLARLHRRLLCSKEEELKGISLLLLDANDVANEYAQQLSFHRDRLSDTIQKYNQLGRSLDDINDQNRELRSSLLKSGAQRDEIKRAFHALEVSCVRCLDGVIQEDSLEGIKQGLNTFALLDEFSSRDLVILEDSASFLNEALALLSKEYRALLKRAESEQMIPLRKQKRSSTKKSVSVDYGDVLKDLKDSDSMLSTSKYLASSRPMTRANSRVMKRQIDDDIATTRDTMRYNMWTPVQNDN